MIRNICKDELFLARKSELAAPEDLPVAHDLLETLIAHQDGCVGTGRQYDWCQQTHHRS